MKKAWKGWQFCDEGAVYHTDGNKAKCGWRVLVIDASDFPEGYPEIDSEWLDDGTRVVVLTHPFLDLASNWRVLVQDVGDLQRRFDTVIRSLKPIPEEPKTAKGEVVGTITVSPEKWEISGAPVIDKWPEGEYDIIKRGDT